jgi:hypothetical protein
MQPDAPFVEPPRRSTARGALQVLGHGACYVGLIVASIVLWLPLRLIGLVAVTLVIAELLMAFTYLHVRHNPAGAVMSVLMIPVILFATGVLIRFRAWLIQARYRWS